VVDPSAVGTHVGHVARFGQTHGATGGVTLRASFGGSRQVDALMLSRKGGQLGRTARSDLEHRVGWLAAALGTAGDGDHGDGRGSQDHQRDEPARPRHTRDLGVRVHAEAPSSVRGWWRAT
jgi:hypothetical protein